MRKIITSLVTVLVLVLAVAPAAQASASDSGFWDSDGGKASFHVKAYVTTRSGAHAGQSMLTVNWTYNGSKITSYGFTLTHRWPSWSTWRPQLRSSAALEGNTSVMRGVLVEWTSAKGLKRCIGLDLRATATGGVYWHWQTAPGAC